uniref:winged helix-turn-helix domain-containing protein n=1 Tax=[Lactobacillus] rogosae TaxID=706562 RepID=UPI00402A6B77
MRIIAKLLLLSLEEDEEVVLNAVMSALGSFENKTQLKEEIACEKLAFAGMEIDASKRLVYRGEKEVNITFTEFEILHLLARNPGRVFSKEQIYDIVWKESYSGDYNIIISHNRNIREKIEDNPSKPIYIHVETCVLLSRKAPDAEIKVRLDMSELDITSAESKAKVPQAGFFYTTKAGITASFVTVQNHPDYLLHIHSIERLID